MKIHKIQLIFQKVFLWMALEYKYSRYTNAVALIAQSPQASNVTAVASELVGVSSELAQRREIEWGEVGIPANGIIHHMHHRDRDLFPSLIISLDGF